MNCIFEDLDCWRHKGIWVKIIGVTRIDNGGSGDFTPVNWDKEAQSHIYGTKMFLKWVL